MRVLCAYTERTLELAIGATLNVNCYLPDELARRAKAAGIPLSTLLQDVVEKELERGGENPGSKVDGLPGVYIRGNGRSRSIVIHLNTASEGKRSGINLMPSERIEEPEKGRRSLTLTEAAIRRLNSALDGDGE